MKHILFILTVVIFLSCGQNDPKQKESDLKGKESDLPAQQVNVDTAIKAAPVNDNTTPEQMILAIQNEFKRINSLKPTAKKYDFVCDTDGTITYYTENGKIVKVVIDWGFIGDGSSVAEYYYKNEKLIFTYDMYIGGPANGPATKNEFRNYVNNDKTIKFMKNKKTDACTTCQFNNASREYKVLKAYNTNNIKSALCN